MSAAMLGGVVVGASVAAATLVCTTLCLALWCRRLRREAGEPSPATFLVSKRKPGPYSSQDHPMAFVLPTITHSEAGSEPRTPTPTPTSTTLTPTLTPTGDRPRWALRPLHSPPTLHSVRETMAGGGVSTLSSPPCYSPTPSLPSPVYQYPPPISPPGGTTPRSSQRPRSASPRTLLPKTNPSRTPPPPLSLPLGGRRWTTGTQTSPITPATPPGLLPRSIFLRKGVQGLEELRAALHHSFLTCDLASPDPTEVTTPDSVDSWAPVWTPASSIGSGGGCGLGEVRLRLRYTARVRQLHLYLHSAHQLPRRLGPHPVDTYIKAVLLPEKKVRFTTPAVLATDRATFHSSFSHDARPARLSHTTLRLSVCQIKECGKRVVVGYASLGLAALGLVPSLSHDLDTGLLNLYLQESAPDQQVGAGGQLEVGLGWDRVAGDLCIRVCRLSSLHLPSLSQPLQETTQVYVKVTVYLNNSILCWRRTSPRDVEGGPDAPGKRDTSTQVGVKEPPPGGVVLEVDEQLTLNMPELDLDATHLVISARLRTRPGCGRRVVGSCLVGRGGCVGEEGRDHWQDMLRAAPELVTRTHSLDVHAAYHDPLPSSTSHSYQDSFDHSDDQKNYDHTGVPYDSYYHPPAYNESVATHQDSCIHPPTYNESYVIPLDSDATVHDSCNHPPEQYSLPPAHQINPPNHSHPILEQLQPDDRLPLPQPSPQLPQPSPLLPPQPSRPPPSLPTLTTPSLPTPSVTTPSLPTPSVTTPSLPTPHITCPSAEQSPPHS